jgi:hypothetical protein
MFHSLEMHVYPTEMVSLLISHSFLSASDGSVKFSTHASFGWSLSLPNGQRLATCSGPVFGIKPTSYRADGYGMLSLLCFLLHLFQYCNTMQAVDGIIACDVLAYQSPFRPTTDLLDEEWTPFDSSPTTTSNQSPSATLAPDWDVLNKIWHSLQELPFAQLSNTSKDIKIVTPITITSHFSPNSTWTPITPQGTSRTSMVALAHTFFYFPTHALNSKLMMLLSPTTTIPISRNATYGPPLLNYIQQRNHGTPAIMQSIDWDAHGMAIRRHFINVFT